MAFLSGFRWGKVAARRSFASLPWLRLVFAAVFAITAYLTLVPLIMLAISSLTASGAKLPLESAHVSFESYVGMLSSGSTYSALLNSTLFALGATTLGISIAVLFGWLIERTDIWCRQLLFVVILIPMAIPNMIYATSWMQLLDANNGLINITLQKLGFAVPGLNLLSLGGMIFIQGIALASHAYLLVAAAFSTVDPTLEEQSSVSGRGTFSTVIHITLPVLEPALFSAIIFFGLVCFETFDIPGMLGLSSGLQLLSTRIYWTTHPEGGQLPDYGTASALSLLLLVIAFVLIQLYQHEMRHARRFVTVTARGYRPKRISLGPWRLPLLLAALAILFVLVVLPLLMLIWRSLLPYYIYPSLAALKQLSFSAYDNLLADPVILNTILNTAVMSIVATGATVAISASIAWLTVRAAIDARWRNRLQLLALLPQAVPSVVIGFSFMIFYLTVPIPIYGTIWIITLALVTKYIAYTTGTMIAAQMQLSNELEEASLIAGASQIATYYRIVLPLLRPAIVNCGLWVLIHTIRELAIAIMLYSPTTQVLSTEVWSLWQGGMIAELCALGVLTIGVLILFLSLPWLFQMARSLTRQLQLAFAPSRLNLASRP